MMRGDALAAPPLHCEVLIPSFFSALLAPGEMRLAALAEGGDAFFGVVGVGGEAAGEGFEDDAVVGAGWDGGVDELFGHLDGDGAVGGYGIGQVEGSFGKLVCRYYFVYKSPLFGLLG